MSTNYYLRLLAVLACLFTTQTAFSQADTLAIFGPSEVCIGECYQYFIEGGSPDVPYVWTLSNGNTITTSGPIAFICWDFSSSGIYEIYAIDPIDSAYILPFTVFVQSFGVLDIIPITNIACPANDSIGGGGPGTTGSCQNVCANTTVTYQVQVQNPTGGFVEWSVTGAEDFIVETDPNGFSSTVTVDWGGPGYGTVEVFSTGFCTSYGSLCVDVLENPEADFTTSPPAVNGTVSICEGQTVFFENTSTGADYQAWYFDILGLSTEVDPSFTFQTAGSYEVMLIARNECLCSDTTFMTVDVANAQTPIIDCVGTICAGEIVTYTTPITCGTYNWSVSAQGTIVDGGGSNDDFITVEWSSGPFGTVELSVAGCATTPCAEPMIERIPIIDGTAQIKGPEQVCNDEIASYSIEKYDATEYNWNVASGGYILEGQGTNTITVQWTSGPSQGNPHIVSVDYTNCYLDCGGYDELEVEVLNEFYFSGPIQVCTNSMQSYIAQNVFPGPMAGFDWEVRATDGTVVFNSPASTNAQAVEWTFGTGKFVVEATPVDPTAYCVDSYESIVTVIAATPEPDGIAGETNICPGISYTYEALSPQPNNTFTWTVNDGGTITTMNGQVVTVTWGVTGPYTLSVAQTDNSGLPCISDTVSVTLNQISTPTITGPTDGCAEATAVYSATNFEKVDYTWSVTPSDAGTILSGQGSDVIEVLWHSPGAHTISLDLCGTMTSHATTVHALPEPVVVFPVGLCPGETVAVFATDVFASYSWRDESGAEVSTAPNPALGPGYYELVVEDAFGCEGNVSFDIEGYEQPEVYISTPDNTGICLPQGDLGPTIYASETGSGYSYQWFRDGTPIGTNSSSVFAGQYGFYQVEVTNADGCTLLSNVLEVFEFCGSFAGGGGGICSGGTCSLPQDCPPGTGVTFDIQPTINCNTSNFLNTSTDMIPNSQEWDFGDGTSSTVEDPTHTYAQAGFYVVILTGISHTTNDLCWDAKVNIVPVAANFRMEDACVGTPAQFEDLSTFVPTTNITSWQWDFGDPASGPDNQSSDENPTHTYALAGTYTVTLLITDTGGCESAITKQVEVFPLPTVSFAQPTENCEGTALEFVANVSSNVVEYDWDFGDPASGNANTATEATTYHAFENFGQYQVMLTATSIYGCSETFSMMVDVTPNGLSGAITASGPLSICQGEQVDLFAPSGGIAWEWSNGAIAEQITVLEEDSYTVTITDAQGCLYTPAPVTLDVIPLPNATIAAIEVNDFGQPVNFFYNTYSICEGEDVSLTIVDANGGYSYQWENGDTGNETAYAAWRGNQLDVGTHVIDLDVEDLSSGCVNTESFTIEVHPVPVNVTISAVGIPLCAGEVATLTVDSPDPAFTYVWNTGEVGTAIDVVISGEYYVRAINAFGCDTESNPIFVYPAPDISRIPSGCHTRCIPDTICLPSMPTVTSYQWYLDGNPIPGPEGTVADYIAMQSGNYHVEMVDFLGCSSTSDVLTLDLFNGFGNILGNVYYDVNENGIIDGPDTLVSGVSIQLQDNSSAVLGTTVTGTQGDYAFTNILSTDYVLVLDVNSLPPLMTVLNDDENELASLFGCDDETEVNWLLVEDCPEISTTLNFEACEGESITYNGIQVLAGDTETFTFLATNGCDSVVTVSVAPQAANAESLDFQACTGTTILYNGDELMAGTQTEYTYQNAAGCDSVVTVTVEELAGDSESVNLVACEGSSVIFDGVELAAGSQTEFSYQNESGCDSVVTVTVMELTTQVTVLDYEICPYESVTYLNTILYPGDTEEFLLIDQYGCDSLVQVFVDAFPEVEFELTGEAVCWNSESGSIQVANVNGGNGPYLYAIDGGIFQANPDFTGLAAGDHEVQVQDENGCVYVQNLKLEEISPIQVALEAEVLACSGPSATITPTLLASNAGLVTYTWPDGSTGFFFEAEEPGLYWVDVSNACESVRYEVEVVREADPLSEYLYLPNAFSPNFDGVNDLFQGFSAPEVDVLTYELNVFDRWGNQLYRTTNISDGWDGLFRGEQMETGVYVYYVDAVVQSCGRIQEVFKKGDVTLVK